MQILLAVKLALLGIYVLEVPTPMYPSLSTITEVKFAPRELTVLRDLTLRNCVLPELTTKTLVLALLESALCAQLALLMLFTELKDATLAVNSQAVMKVLRGALVLVIIEFTRQLITHADADQASISRMLIALVKVNPQIPLIAFPLFTIVVMEKVKLELLTASALRLMTAKLSVKVVLAKETQFLAFALASVKRQLMSFVTKNADPKLPQSVSHLQLRSP